MPILVPSLPPPKWRREMLWRLFKRVIDNGLLDFGEILELALKVAIAIVLLPLVLAWPGILIIKIIGWFKTSEWADLPAGTMFLGPPPETLWLGLNSIIAWFWDVDIVTWGIVVYLLAWLGVLID